jgi:hypothetical protein
MASLPWAEFFENLWDNFPEMEPSDVKAFYWAVAELLGNKAGQASRGPEDHSFTPELAALASLSRGEVIFWFAFVAGLGNRFDLKDFTPAVTEKHSTRLNKLIKVLSNPVEEESGTGLE